MSSISPRSTHSLFPYSGKVTQNLLAVSGSMESITASYQQGSFSSSPYIALTFAPSQNSPRSRDRWFVFLLFFFSSSSSSMTFIFLSMGTGMRGRVVPKYCISVRSFMQYSPIFIVTEGSALGLISSSSSRKGRYHFHKSLGGQVYRKYNSPTART